MGRHFTLIALLLASSAYADTTLNLTQGVTPISHDIYNLHMTIFWICVVIGIVVFGIMFYAVFNHRKSKGATPAQFHEHLSLELAWTIIPLIILIVMAVPATKVLSHMDNSDKPDLNIKITGFQWKWRYEYLDHDIKFFSNLATPLEQMQNKSPKNADYLRAVDHPLVVPIHKKIRFLITSNDVIHAWWVPDFAIKRDAVPGFINEGWARINKPGIYYGQCAELCGINHAFMPIVVRAVPEKEFSDWIAAQKGQPVAASKTAVAMPKTTASTAATFAVKKLSRDELMKKGEQIFTISCAVCHKQDGSGQPPVFPALKNSKTVRGPINKHIEIVMNGRPGTSMQAFKDQLSDEDIAAVITFERNAWGNNMKDEVQPSEITAAKGKK